MKAKLFVIIAGAFGGISPNILSLGIALTGGDTTMPEATYFFGLLIFAVMGAGMAFIWDETDLKKAFYLGIGLPSIIQIGVEKVTSTNESNAAAEKNHAFLSFMVTPAVAQTMDETVAGRKLKIILPGKLSTAELVFCSSNDRYRERVPLDQSTSIGVVDIPQRATRFAIKVGTSMSLYETLPALRDDTTAIQVMVSEKSWSGFKQALGVSAIDQYQIDLKRIR